MKKLKVIVIGLGSRGTTYAKHGFDACPEFELVGIADPDPERRNYVKEYCKLDDSACFESWEDILAVPKFADAAIIAQSSGLEDPEIRVVFMTDVHDTRFDAYSVLRPLSAAH